MVGGERSLRVFIRLMAHGGGYFVVGEWVEGGSGSEAVGEGGPETVVTTPRTEGGRRGRSGSGSG